MRKDNIIFQITEEDVQAESMERLGRKLTDDEMRIARKGIEWGLGDAALVPTYGAIFGEMIKGGKGVMI
ncbi:MAG: hypothetical protein FWE23_02435 [Chitinivibrionia bacterium]|nr:hypothetical protein [Chitinivibrionia bacterium]